MPQTQAKLNKFSTGFLSWPKYLQYNKHNNKYLILHVYVI